MLGELFCLGIGADVEADDDGVRGGGEHDVALRDGARGGVDDAHAHFLVLELFERALDGFDRALHVGFDDELELLHLAFGDLGKHVVERHLLRLLDHRFALLVSALFLHLLHERLVDGEDGVARVGDVFEAEDGDGGRRACLLDRPALIVDHGADAAHRGARNEVVARVQRTILHEHARHGALALIELGFDDDALGVAVGIGGEFLHLGDQPDVFEEVVDACARLGGDGHDDDVAAPLLGHEIVFHEPLLDLIGVCLGLIHLVHGDDDGHIGGLCVVDGLHRLRHDAVVRRNDENDDIGDGRAARTHGGERRVAGGIDEGDLLAFAEGDGVRADALRDAARLAFRDVGLADGVKEGGLAVVDVAHDGDDGRARHALFRVVRAVVLFEEGVFRRLRGLVFEVDAEL